MIPGFPEITACKGEKTVTFTEDERNMVHFVSNYLNYEDFHQMYYKYNKDEGKSSPEMDAAMELWDNIINKICNL
jgi:hypothetical protein